MPRSPRPIGDSLVELAERLPAADLYEIWSADRAHPAEAAVDTPFLVRMRALLAAIDADGAISVAQARRVLGRAAPMGHLQPGPQELFEADLLLAALHRDLLRCTETEGWAASAVLSDRGSRPGYTGAPRCRTLPSIIGLSVGSPTSLCAHVVANITDMVGQADQAASLSVRSRSSLDSSRVIL